MPDLTPGLGAKIRELRLRRGMTQKELAGERISRNMLSLIESGSASPSVATLCYLAERLDTPVGAFFLSPEFDRQYRKLSVIDGIKARFSEKDWRGCEALCGEVPAELIDDEIALLLAVSCLMNAAQSAALAASRPKMHVFYQNLRAEIKHAPTPEHTLTCSEPLTNVI